ncbi:cytochrome P450 [Thozetella sp. PMI_491]|nr:cytochrome P450 [Thozetella sp. PMI_491]
MVSTEFPTGPWASSTSVVIFSIAIGAYLSLWAYLYLTHDSREPPLAPCIIPIPFIGPIIEMRWKKSNFPLYMKAKFPEPIYTIRVPGKRFYFVNSKALIAPIQKQYRTLSFDPAIIQGVRSILGVSPVTLDIMNRGVTPGSEISFLARLNRAVHPSLSAGSAALDAMNRGVVEILERSLSEFAEKGPTVIKMYDWIRRTVMVATTDIMFGPGNPFKEPENVDAWIEFETKGMPLLALDVLPDWMMREGIRARETLVTAMDRYMIKRSLGEASDFLQRRVEFYLQEGVPENDISRLAVADNIAFSSNLIPTEFWFLYHLFSDPVILKDCREEIEMAVQHKADGTHLINFDYVKNSCPVLQSTWREVFRVHGFGLVPRRALADHMLDNRYLIKKEGTVFTPYRVQHHDPNNWGVTQGEFDYKRFLRGSGLARHDPAVLRGFGNGAHLCPGRHFASAEILLFTTLVILRFDAKPVGGSWPRPSVERSSQVAAVDQPDHDLHIELQPRIGVSQKGWSVDFSSSGHVSEVDSSFEAASVP